MFIDGLIVHVFFLFSIFDIYFKSPIVKNVPSYQPEHEAVADRLVLFVVDGLRAESLINYTTLEYMRSIVKSKGRWGISHTRVPTESRPGHVAVIAGFYEDPSAVAKGWKENPVDFDSVFNQTRYTWCWGTYDIVDIFTKGSVDSHITVNKFDPYAQTFSTDKNTTLLDDWVFNNVVSFFKTAQEDAVLNQKLHKDKIVFFLHLLGTDTSGHTHKPKTENFVTTLKFVDQGIKQAEILIRDFYKNDGKTTFLMTSDHGMTDWGSHGAGDDHETQTPYILWGAGVDNVEDLTQLDSSTLNLPLGNRRDINQADLTPLMSTVLSVPVPVNSIGQLPADVLRMTPANKARAIYSNSRQLASQYNKKRSDVEDHAISLLYQPFEPLDKRKYEELVHVTELLLQEKNYEKLVALGQELMHLSLLGLTYYHNYYQRPLLILVTLAFIGWIACLMKKLVEQNINTRVYAASLPQHKAVNNRITLNIVNASFGLLNFCSVYIVYVQNLPVQYYIYFIMPNVLWWRALSSMDSWIHFVTLLSKQRLLKASFVEGLCYILGSLAMGLSFTHRWMLSVPLCGLALWPFLSRSRDCLSPALLAAWSVSCLLLSGFSFMPVVGKEVFIELVILAGLIWMVFYAIYVNKVLRPLCAKGLASQREIFVSCVQIALLGAALHNIYVQSKRFENATPVSYFDQATAWIIALCSVLLPLGASARVAARLAAAGGAWLTLYLQLSVAHEGLFLVTLMAQAACWVLIEFRLVHSEHAKIVNFSFENSEYDKDGNRLLAVERSLSKKDFRRAFFFLLYIIVAFFGTGNIASLNSFEVRWVTCFVTSFQPFVITALVLLKTLAPFLVVACCFRAVQVLTKAPTGYLTVIVLIYSNIMGIQLLYNVKNTGSWLEIGMSISQFVIVQVITLFIVIINQAAKWLTQFSIYDVVNPSIFRRLKKHV